MSMLGKRRRSPRFRRVLILLAAVCVLLGSGVFYVSARLRPMIAPIAVAEAKSVAAMAINTAVDEQLNLSQVGYDDLITLEKDADNHVTALKANAVEMNRLRADLTIAIQNKVDRIRDSVVEIPLGTVINSELLSGVGPNVRVRLSPVGFVEANITNSFTAAGINQTRHQVVLSVSATLAIAMPAATEYARVDTAIVLGESVLVGEVPKNYMNFGAGADEYKRSDFLSFSDPGEFYYDDEREN